MPLRVGYCRVSTRSAEQRASIEAQAARLREAGCDRVLIDHGVSGFREEARAGSAFPELIELILGGTVSEVVVPHFDRTQRRVKWGLELLDALEHAGICLVELDTGAVLDPARNPSDVLLAQIRSAVQENESRVRRLKVRGALAAMRGRGLYASGKLPFGYAVTDGVIHQHPQQWEAALKRWHELEDVGFNISAWRAEAGAAAPTLTARGVRCWLVNPILRGIAPPGYTAAPVPALIDARQWHLACRALAERSHSRGVSHRRQPRLFTGLVRCVACDHNLHSVREPRQTGPDVWRLKCLWQPCSCYGRGIRQDVVRRAAIDALAGRHEQLAACAATPAAAASADANLSSEEEQLREDIERLEALAHLDGVEPLLAAARIRLAQHTIKAGEEREQNELSAALLNELFADPATLDAGSDEELRPILLEFIARIDWHGATELSVHFR